jgi:hypothetical protein
MAMNASSRRSARACGDEAAGASGERWLVLFTGPDKQHLVLTYVTLKNAARIGWFNPPVDASERRLPLTGR